jgi:Family of unknown function (DUF5989)
MSDLEKGMQRSEATGNLLSFLWQRKSWWLLPVAVLFFLLGILYVLGHMSSADPETYPTTRQNNSAVTTVC